MKAIGIILAGIVAIFVFISFASYLYTFSLKSHDWVYFIWTWINGLVAWITAFNCSSSFYKWFKSQLK